jgi:hypothetical protein
MSRRLSYLIGFAVICLMTLLGAPLPAAALPAFMMVGEATDTDNTSEILKIIFDEPLIVNVTTDFQLMGAFEVDSNVMREQTTGGRYIETAQQFALSGGVRAVDQLGAFPQATPPVYQNARIYLKKIGGSVEITGDELRKVIGDVGSYINFMERALPDLVERLRNTLDRQYMGYGYGVKARVTTIGSYNTPAAGQFNITAEDTLGIDGWDSPWLQFLEQEQDVFTSQIATAPITLRNAGVNQAAILKNITPETNVLTFEGPESLRDAIVAGDYIADGDKGGSAFPSGSSTLTTREISGLLAAIDDGNIVATYNNIARANQRLWQGQVIDGNSGEFDGTLSETLLNFADRRARVRGAGKVNLIAVSEAGYDSYWKSLKTSQQFVNPQGSFTGGRNDDLTIILGARRVRLTPCRKMPSEVAFGVDTTTFKRYSLNKWEWINQTGSIWRPVSDVIGQYDQYVALGALYEELSCGAPARNWRLDNLVATA